MDVLLINPPLSTPEDPTEHLGLAYLAAVLRKASKYEVDSEAHTCTTSTTSPIHMWQWFTK